MLLEEESFKASFEGREGRAVTESERKRIPDWTAEKQKARPPCWVFFFFFFCLFLFLKKGMRKFLSSEEERRNQEVT